MPGILLQGTIKDSGGRVSEIFEIEVTPLPDKEWDSVDTREEEVTVTGTGETPGRMCRTATTPIHWKQKMQHEKYTYYVAIEQSGWKTFGKVLLIGGGVAIVAVLAALAAPALLPALAVVGTTAAGTAGAVLTTAGGVTLAVGGISAGVGATIVWGTPDGYDKGAVLRTAEADVAVGQAQPTFGRTTYSGVHPCKN